MLFIPWCRFRFLLLSFSSAWRTPFRIMSWCPGDEFPLNFRVWKSILLPCLKDISQGIKLYFDSPFYLFIYSKKDVTSHIFWLGLFPKKKFVLILIFVSFVHNETFYFLLWVFSNLIIIMAWHSFLPFYPWRLRGSLKFLDL